ncbi:helix-turn-helix transcriptional regulator [Sphingomonas sp.]|uniref:helix-turn-helix domain-containing protein n=1 Tax=Sphingomonas sp. TaxID=28214 RepID=UPI00343C2F7D
MATGRATTPGFRDPRYRQLIERLSAERRTLNMTQAELAIKLGLHKQFVSRVELGERRLDVIELVDFARALGIDPASLVTAVGTPSER